VARACAGDASCVRGDEGVRADTNVVNGGPNGLACPGVGAAGVAGATVLVQPVHPVIAQVQLSRASPWHRGPAPRVQLAQ